MFENLKTRVSIIFFFLVVSIYFLMPTVNLYSKYNTLTLDEIKSLENQSINLGLDLKGGLRIVLELDDSIYLKRLSKSDLRASSVTELDNFINRCILYTTNNNADIIQSIKELSKQENIKLNKYYSNLSVTSNNDEIIQLIKEHRLSTMGGILDIMRNRIADHDQYGLGEPTIQKIGDNRLIVELAGITDLQKAKAYIQRTADFEISLVKEDDFIIFIKNIENYFINKKISFSEFLINENIITNNDLVAIFNIKERVNKENFIIESQNEKIISSGAFGKDNINNKLLAKETIDSYLYKNINLISLFDQSFPFINEQYYILLSDFFNHKQIQQNLPKGSKIVWASQVQAFGDELYRKVVLVASKPVITAGMILNPKAKVSELGSDNAGKWVVNLDMNKKGRILWSKFTERNIYKKAAIILDNQVFFDPTIQSKIPNGKTQISGFDNMQEAKEIASVLKAGELPAPINAVQTNFIGPSLGEQSINSGSKAMFLGIILVFIFMIFYYKGSGLVANIALMMNLLFVLGILVTLDAILTLPGIAGLLLTVGMTVDANVIIFERIKEELNLGVNVKKALHAGYNKAFSTILDANITTLITAFVLSFIGSGPIKGFATTLSVGIICSMFTAIFVTKTIFLIYLQKTDRLSI